MYMQKACAINSHKCILKLDKEFEDVLSKKIFINRWRLINFAPYPSYPWSKLQFESLALFRADLRRSIFTNTWTIHPCSRFAFWRSNFMLFVLIISLINVPLNILVNLKSPEGHSSRSLKLVQEVTESAFVFYILSNFFMGYKRNGKIELRLGACIKHYVFTYFAFDSVSSIAFFFSTQNTYIVEYVTLLRLTRLFSMVKCLKYLLMVSLLAH